MDISPGDTIALPYGSGPLTVIALCEDTNKAWVATKPKYGLTNGKAWVIKLAECSLIKSVSAPTNEPPFCECGCGEPVKGRANGIWSRWRPGHHHRRFDGASRPTLDTKSL
jgi:hypothetical protein